jgi:hypothetical protein
MLRDGCVLGVGWNRAVGDIVGSQTSLLSADCRGLAQEADEHADRHVNYHPTARVHHACSSNSQRLRLISRQFRPSSGDIFITNWNGVGAYDLAFADGPPSYFHPIILGDMQLPQWFIIIYELPCASGSAVTIGLPRTVARQRPGKQFVSSKFCRPTPARKCVEREW